MSFLNPTHTTTLIPQLSKVSPCNPREGEQSSSVMGLTWGAAGPETATRGQTLHILLGRPAATSPSL